VHPSLLSPAQINKELKDRKIKPTLNVEQNLNLLTNYVETQGGYDNGVTTDLKLAKKKRDLEDCVHRVDPKEFFQTSLRFQSDYAEKIMEQYENNENISFNYDWKLRVLYMEGRYENVCKVRASALKDFQTNGKFGTSIKLSDIENYREDLLEDLKHLCDGSELPPELPQGEFILSLFGDVTQRNKVLKILCHKYTPVKKMKLYKSGIPGHNDGGTLTFSGINGDTNEVKKAESTDVIELHMMSGISRVISNNDINVVSKKYGVQIVNAFFEVQDYRSQQLSVQGSRDAVYKALVQLDNLCIEQKKNIWEIVISPEIKKMFYKKWESIAEHFNTNYKHSVLHFQPESGSIQIESNSDMEVKKILAELDYQIYLCEFQSVESKRRSIIDTRDHLKTLDLSEFGIGGLSKQFNILLRRTFQSRMVSSALRKELGLSHCRGVLFHGPTGTGKSLIAKNIANILGCPNPKFIHSPEIESKWVGESEKNLREVFADAVEDYEARWRTEPSLHVIIFDEIDAITRERGGHNAKARDGALHQLLCELDGMKEIDNLLVFGLTNRMEDIDSAVLRPGRFEAHIEIDLPDCKGREEIFHIHTASMRKFGRLDETIDFGVLAEASEGFSGAEIASVIRIAQSYALETMVSEEDCMITLEDMERAILEVRRDKLILKEKKDSVPEMEDGPAIT